MGKGYYQTDHRKGNTNSFLTMKGYSTPLEIKEPLVQILPRFFFHRSDL